MIMENTVQIKTTDELVEQSAATKEFKTAVTEFAETQRPDDRIEFAAGNPPVKVLRVICGILEQFPELEIDSISVSGRSGCSDYTGEAIVNGDQKFRFVWDCAWKAEQLGWKDWLGSPDQIKAARTYGYQCFKTLEKIS